MSLNNIIIEIINILKFSKYYLIYFYNHTIFIINQDFQKFIQSFKKLIVISFIYF